MNILERQITHEGQRNVVVKFTGVLDEGDFIESPAIRLSEMANNDSVAGPLTGFRVDMIEWSMSNGLEVMIEWDSQNPQQLFPISGRGRINAWNYGGYLPDTSRIGYTGDISIKSAGYAAGRVANFTVALELIKLYRPSYNGTQAGGA